MAEIVTARTLLHRRATRRALLAGSLVAAVGSRAGALAQADGTPQQGGTVTLSLNADVVGLDPHLSSGKVSGQVMQLIFDNLFDYDVELNVIPMLATDWQISDDGLVYTFPLVENATFHDGEPFNAAAVKTNLDRVLDPDVGSRLTSQLTGVLSVDVIDDYTVQLTLEQPLAPLLSVLAGRAGSIISPRAITDFGADLVRNPVGTGPFRFVEWLDDDHVTVQRADSYWRPDLPHLDEVNYTPIAEGTVRVTALRTAEIDMIDLVGERDAQALQDDPELMYSETSGLGFRYIMMNTAAEPFSNMALRQAVAWTIDREAIVDALFFGHGTPATGPIPTSNWAYDPSLVGYQQDYEQARTKLAEAGMPDGFEFTMFVPNTPEDIQLAEVYRAQMGEVGIVANLEVLEFATLLERAYAGDFVSHTGNWSGGPDPDSNTYGYFHSEGGVNRPQYSNPQVDALMEESRTVSDREARQAALSEALRIVINEAPMIFVMYPAEIKAWRNELQGFVHVPDGIMRMDTVWLDED